MLLEIAALLPGMFALCGRIVLQKWSISDCVFLLRLFLGHSNKHILKCCSRDARAIKNGSWVISQVLIVTAYVTSNV